MLVLEKIEIYSYVVKTIQMQNIKNIRTEYTKGNLEISDLDKDPMHQLQIWINQAVETNVAEPTAMCLSTIKSDGRVSVE